MEKQIICLRGWLHNLHEMKIMTEKANNKYKKINNSIFNFYTHLNKNMEELKQNLLYVVLFVVSFPIVLYLFNIMSLSNLIKILVLEIFYLGLISFVIQIILNKNNLLKDLSDYDIKNKMFQEEIKNIEKLIKDVEKINNKCKEIDDIIDSL